MAGGLGKLAVDTTIDTFGRFAKQFVDNPKVLNMLGNSSPQTKRALNRTFASNPQAGKTATDLVRSGDYKGYREFVTGAQLEHSKNAAAHRTSQITHPTNLDEVENLKYPRYQVDESLPFKQQKRIFKGQVANYINQEWAAGNKIDLPVAYKKFGQLINPETGLPVHLKYKKTDPKTGLRSYEPKPQETTARETAKRKSRETPWVTEKDQIKSILKEVGEEAKLAKLLKLIRTQYKAKKDAIKAAGLSKGHQKALHNGGLDVPENIIGEQGVSTKEVRGNYARQYKEDPSDAELMKQGAFVGTLKEYILMKLKEVE